MKNDFTETFERMGIDKSLLTLLFGAHRSTIHKYLDGTVTEIPASATTLIRLLEFLQNRNPELFCEWAVLQDFNTPAEIYLNSPEYWEGWKFASHKVKPVVLQYLQEHLPEDKQD